MNYGSGFAGWQVACLAGGEPVGLGADLEDVAVVDDARSTIAAGAARARASAVAPGLYFSDLDQITGFAEIRCWLVV